MRFKNLFLLCLLVIPGGVTPAAQETLAPDLSGTWQLNLQKSKLLKGNNIRSETVVINCS